MPFLNVPEATVDAEGPTDALIAFVGEAPSTEEIRTGRPFTGRAGGVFDQCLRSARLIRSQCYITNVSKTKLPGNNSDVLISIKKNKEEKRDYGHFTRTGTKLVETLQDELRALKACKLVIPMGNTALAACTYDAATNKGRAGISTIRGYRIDTSYVGKLLPTLHPATVLYGDNYLQQYDIAHDFSKARKIINGELSEELPRVIIPRDLDSALEILEDFYEAQIFACDAEVVNYEVSCLSFCRDTKTRYTDEDGVTYQGVTYSIPIHGVWTEDDEVQLWRSITRVLENPRSEKIFQNGVFDIGFFGDRNGILVQGKISDTMVAHHIMYPDFRKGLGYLASLETNLPYWKDMVQFHNIKGDS